MLPSGVVTFVFTDVVGSTRLWETEPEAMAPAMARHDELVEAAVLNAGGDLVRPRGEGDSRFAVFVSARQAVSTAAALGRALETEEWPTSSPVVVRTALHTGEADLRAGDYYGDVVNRCARLRSLAHPGQILLTATTAGLVEGSLPPGTSVTDLGEHRLKDLTRPEHVFQLNHRQPAPEFPPLLSLDRARHNLPVQTSSFVGRDREVAVLAAAVREHRLVTLLGPGGIGKTRLALQVAAEVATAEGGDVWFVDLSGLQDGALVPARIAETIGVPWSAREPADVLVEALQAKPTLLVLDNLEQVVSCAPFVSELLSATPLLRIIGTSHEALHVRGERQIPVDPLPSPEAGASAESVSAFDAVQLFLGRAALVRPDFTLTASNATAVATLCSRLDGHPLALELAAARMKMLSIEELIERLQAGVGVLGGGSRDMPERHRTLKATIARSVDALTDAERELLTGMSLLPAPADFELVEALAGPELDAYDLLDSLVEKSLVRTVESTRTRYGLHVSIRDYCAELLTAERRRLFQDRHADHYQHKLEAAFAIEHEAMPHHSALMVLVSNDLDHVRAAIAHRRELGPAAAEVSLVRCLDESMVQLGHPREYLEISERALHLAEEPEQLVTILRARAEARSMLTPAAVDQEERRRLLHEAARCSDPWYTSIALQIAIATSRTADEVLAVADELERVLPLLQGEARRTQELERHNMLAKALRFVDPRRAEHEARELIDGPWDDIGRARLAWLELDGGRFRVARELIEPLADPEKYFVNEPHWQRTILRQRALVMAHESLDPEEAVALAQRALDEEWRTDALPIESAHVLAEVHHLLGSTEQALQALDRVHSRVPRPLTFEGASIVWRRAVALRRLGRSLADDQLGEACEVLATPQAFLAVRDLLAALVERAVRLADDAPGEATRVLAWVRAHRRAWTLPFGMDDEIPPVLGRLLPEHQQVYDEDLSDAPVPFLAPHADAG